MSVRRLVDAFLRNLSNLLIVLGVTLFVVGAAVQLSRRRQVAQGEAAGAAPAFDTTVRSAAPLAVSPADPAPTPDALVPDRLTIPALDIDTPVMEVGWAARIVNGENQGNEWSTASFAAGFHRDSALPGTTGNTVLSGHNNIAGAVFARLHEAEPGDQVFLHDGARQLAYEVEQNFIVREADVPLEQRRENAKWIAQTPDERLTIVTCFPPWGNTHRTIVVARPVQDGEAEAPRAEVLE